MATCASVEIVGSTELLHPAPFHSYQLPAAVSANTWPFCATSRLDAEPPAADWPFSRIEKPPAAAAPKPHTPSAVERVPPLPAGSAVPSGDGGMTEGLQPDPFHSYQLPNAVSANR